MHRHIKGMQRAAALKALQIPGHKLTYSAILRQYQAFADSDFSPMFIIRLALVSAWRAGCPAGEARTAMAWPGSSNQRKASLVFSPCPSPSCFDCAGEDRPLRRPGPAADGTSRCATKKPSPMRGPWSSSLGGQELGWMAGSQRPARRRQTLRL